MLPQDLKFSKDELEKCFGPKMTRKQYLQLLRKQYDRKEGEDNGSETTGCSESDSICFA